MSPSRLLEGPTLLEGKVAFITGSTRGIGWATARLFADQGATVVLNGSSDQTAIDAKAAELGPGVWGIQADASDPAAIKDCYKRIFQRHKRLDVLVNNAGIMQGGMLGMIGVDVIQRTLAVNTVAPLLHVQEASRLMARNGGGAIVNLTSILGRLGGEGQALYSASKAAVIGLTLAAAKELSGKGIRVNAVAPGYISTEMTKDIAMPPIRLGRAGTPEDVARAILFLASDLASYVTGQILGVDGGMTV